MHDLIKGKMIASNNYEEMLGLCGKNGAVKVVKYRIPEILIDWKMENLLQIDIYRGRIKAVIKGENEQIEIKFLKMVKRWALEVDLNKIIKIICMYNDDGDIFYAGNQVLVQQIDCVKKELRTSVCFSQEQIKDAIFKKMDNTKRKVLDTDQIDKFRGVRFNRDVFIGILQLTQQYILFRDLYLKKPINVKVMTIEGQKDLFVNGEGKKIQTQIVDIIDQSEDEVSEEVNRNEILDIICLNNSITALNFTSSTFFLNACALTEQKEQATIYIKSDIKEFWSNIHIVKVNGSLFWEFIKG